MFDLGALLQGLGSGLKEKPKQGFTDTSGDHERQVQMYIEHIRNGGTPPFASDPAWEEARRRAGGIGGGRGMGDIVGMIQRILGGGPGGQQQPNAPSSPMPMGQPSVKPSSLRDRMLQQFDNGDTSTLGNPIRRTPDESWKTAPLGENPYNSTGVWDPNSRTTWKRRY